jgi:hypothetical protein
MEWNASCINRIFVQERPLLLGIMAVISAPTHPGSAHLASINLNNFLWMFLQRAWFLLLFLLFEIVQWRWRRVGTTAIIK